MLLITIFYYIDNFCKIYEEEFSKKTLGYKNKLGRKSKLHISEIITIMLYYHYSGYKTFKDYYTKHVLSYMKNDFKNLVSYNRFVELQRTVLPIMNLFLKMYALGTCTGVSFIDSFALKVCHIKRSSSNKVFKDIAAKGKTSVGWFFGFKVHLVINYNGEIINFYVTSGNVADNNERVIESLTENLFGKIYGDKGYLINQEFMKKLYCKGIHIITKLRSNMKNKLMLLEDKLILRKRGIIETVGGILKSQLSFEHSRYRNPLNFLINICSTLISYAFYPNKPFIPTSSYISY